MTAAFLSLFVTAAPALKVDVFVPLCDSELIECGRGAAGDPESLAGNLYWGAAYGAERFLSRAEGFKVESRIDHPRPHQPQLLREVRLRRTGAPGERAVVVRLLAYSGKAIDSALADFLLAAGGASDADVVAWAGHDRLMDVTAPVVSSGASPKPVVVLACSSQQYFGPVLAKVGARPLAWTRTFMVPEAYLLEAVARALAQNGLSPDALRRELTASYAKYQRITPRAASSVFAPVPRGADHP